MLVFVALIASSECILRWHFRWLDKNVPIISDAATVKTLLAKNLNTEWDPFFPSMIMHLFVRTVVGFPLPYYFQQDLLDCD